MKQARVLWILMGVLVACQSRDPLVATWKIAQVSYTPSGMATPEALEQGRQWQQMGASLRNSTFALYAENKSAFFSTRTPFRQGSWERNGDLLTLMLGEGSRPYQFEIVDQTGNTLVLTLLDDNLTDGELTLICQKSALYTHDGKDLLAPEQNTWRKKATQKESKAEIEARVKAHLDYLITYFEGVEDKKQTYFETGLVSSPFVFYSHGLGLSRDTRFARQWLDTFYDEADAATGFQLLKTSLRSLSRFPKANTFTQEYLLAFQQMRRSLDQ